MTYDQLAEATGISRRTLVNLGTGTYQGYLRTWLVPSRAWKVSLDELLDAMWD